MNSAHPLNVLYFVTHDTGRFISPYHPQLRSLTPNLQRFAAESLRFDQAFCTSPCCGPSRACAMTGKYPAHTGALGLGSMGWLLPDEERTTVDDFNDAGYDTVHVGFCHERLYGGMRYRYDGTPEDESWWKCDSRLAVDKAIEWLEQRDGSRPFYLNLATNETHDVHFTGLFTESRHGGPVPAAEVWVPPAYPDIPEARRIFGNWYASLRYMDHHFGRLMEALDRLGLRDQTLVVFTTDHGAGANPRGKRMVYDLGTEIALLLRMPDGTRAGESAEALVPNIDFRPTLAEACGLPAPAGIDGRSFWPLVTGAPYAPHESLQIQRNYHGERPTLADVERDYIDYFDPQRAVRTRDWHYVRNLRPGKRPRCLQPWEIRAFHPRYGANFPSPPPSDPRPAEELYYVRADRWETHDLAPDPACAEVKARLAAELDAFLAATNDPALREELPPPLVDPAVWPVPGKTHAVERR